MEKVNLTFRKDGKKDTDSSTYGGRQNVSFKFSKQTSKKLPGSNESFAVPDREMILSVEDKQIKSTVPKEEKKKKLVIHPVQKNVWRTTGNDSQKNTLDELAVKELLQESAIENEKWEKREFSNFTVTIPMVIQNKIPEGFETDDKLDVGLRAEESNLHDYENVPIEEYGEALLRGLGCKPGDPVGNKNQQAVVPIEAVVRSKGLGLGADIKQHKKKTNTDEKDDLKLVAGAYVRILQGAHDGHYGEVEGLDESRVVIKLSSRQNKTVSLPLLYVDVVSRKEFKKECKVINRTAYTEYNREHAPKNGYEAERSVKREDDDSKDGHHLSNSSSRQKENSHSAKRSGNSDENTSSRKSHKKRKHSPERDSKQSSSDYREQRQDNWVSPLLRVRFIDELYKKGKFFNQKMIVDDVISTKICTCKTEDGKYLEDISPSMLETIVPRSESSYVMVVRGKYKRQLGAILKRDKSNCIATIHFLSDRSKVVELGYDSICEYVGDVSQYD